MGHPRGEEIAKEREALELEKAPPEKKKADNPFYMDPKAVGFCMLFTAFLGGFFQIYIVRDEFRKELSGSFNGGDPLARKMKIKLNQNDPDFFVNDPDGRAFVIMERERQNFEREKAAKEAAYEEIDEYEPSIAQRVYTFISDSLQIVKHQRQEDQAAAAAVAAAATADVDNDNNNSASSSSSSSATASSSSSSAPATPPPRAAVAYAAKGA